LETIAATPFTFLKNSQGSVNVVSIFGKKLLLNFRRLTMRTEDMLIEENKTLREEMNRAIDEKERLMAALVEIAETDLEWSKATDYLQDVARSAIRLENS
jgi:hypothetical protein